MDFELKVLLVGKERDIRKLPTDTKKVPSNVLDSGFAESHLMPSCVVGETIIPNKMVQRAANCSKIKEMKRNNKWYKFTFWRCETEIKKM